LPFYRIGGERAAAVVRHIGMKAGVSEGNRPRWWWGVMWSRCSGCCGSGGGTGEEDDRTGLARQRGRRGKGQVGQPKATGPVGRWASVGERGGGLWLGQKPERGQSSKRNSFRISIDFRNLAKVWKIAQGDLGRNLTWGFFLSSSRLSKYFRKMKYAMPCYATLDKIN
jgi:hypothetical protein